MKPGSKYGEITSIQREIFDECDRCFAHILPTALKQWNVDTCEVCHHVETPKQTRVNGKLINTLWTLFIVSISTHFTIFWSYTKT